MFDAFTIIIFAVVYVLGGIGMYKTTDLKLGHPSLNEALTFLAGVGWPFVVTAVFVTQGILVIFYFLKDLKE